MRKSIISAFILTKMRTRNAAVLGCIGLAVLALLSGSIEQAEALTVSNFQSLFRTMGTDLDFTLDVSSWDGGPVVPTGPFFTSPGADFTEFGDSGAGFGLGGTGLGTITVDITRSAGAVGTVTGTFHSFYDLEIDEATTTFFNEFAGAGALGGGVDPDTFEIDEPGFVFGDIDVNFRDGTLDNTNAVPVGSPDDVAVALGWDLSLDIGESALLTLVVSDAGLTAPGSSFSIMHFDTLVPGDITYSGALSVTSTTLPVPGTLALMGIGLVALAVTRTRKKRV